MSSKIMPEGYSGSKELATAALNLLDERRETILSAKNWLGQPEEIELTDDDIIEYIFEETGIDYAGVEVVDEGLPFPLINRKG